MAGDLLEIEKTPIYSVILGDTGASEDDDLEEILEVIRQHLDAAERSGKSLLLQLFPA